MGAALVAISAPVYWLGLVSLYLFAKDIGKFPLFDGAGSYKPLSEDPSQWFGSLIMPWFVLAATFAAFYARLLRANLLETMSEDYIRTARAKGLTERRVVLGHGVRAAITPIVTVLGLDIGILLGGAILTETVFNIPGVGPAGLRRDPARGPPGHPGHRALRGVLHRAGEPRRGHRLRLHRPPGALPVSPRAARRRGPARPLPHRGRRGQGRGRNLLLGRSRQGAGNRRRVGLGQERFQSHDHGPHALAERRHLGAGGLRRARPADPGQRGDAPGARRRHRDDLPGPAVLPAPLLQGRAPARGGDSRPPGRLQGPGARSRHRPARPRGDPRAAPAGRPLPARVLRGHAPARHDRDGAVQRAEGADRRRADHGPGRHRAGADPRSDRAAQGRAGHGRDHHHPRSRGGGRDGGRDRGDVRRPDRRAGARRHDLRRPRAPLHVGPAELDSPPRHAARRGPRAHSRQASQPHHAAQRLPLPPALPLRARSPPQGRSRARAHARRRGSPGRLPAGGRDAAAPVARAADRRARPRSAARKAAEEARA